MNLESLGGTPRMRRRSFPTSRKASPPRAWPWSIEVSTSFTAPSASSVPRRPAGCALRRRAPRRRRLGRDRAAARRGAARRSRRCCRAARASSARRPGGRPRRRSSRRTSTSSSSSARLEARLQRPPARALPRARVGERRRAGRRADTRPTSATTSSRVAVEVEAVALRRARARRQRLDAATGSTRSRAYLGARTDGGAARLVGRRQVDADQRARSARSCMRDQRGARGDGTRPAHDDSPRAGRAAAAAAC